MLARAVLRLPAAFCNIRRWEALSQAPTTWFAAILPSTRPSGAAAIACNVRHASSSSSTRWKSRQGKDAYAREAKVAGLKSRAAFKLLEINDKHRIFKKGDTVVDLGFAPGGWSQVAVNRTSPGGRVVGIDVIPAQPPRGANALQGNFLSAEIREEVRNFVSDPNRGRVRQRGLLQGDVSEEELDVEGRGIVELERHALEEEKANATEADQEQMTQKELDLAEGRVVNIVLSDMMLNTSGVQARDHGGSMDLCMAALTFAYDTLTTGGHFLCKFYTGSEDHALEMKLKKLFDKVHRVKPDATRKESKEAYFLGLRRKAGVSREDVVGEV